MVSRVVDFFLIQMMFRPLRSSSESQIIGTSMSHRRCYVSRYMFHCCVCLQDVETNRTREIKSCVAQMQNVMD